MNNKQNQTTLQPHKRKSMNQNLKTKQKIQINLDRLSTNVFNILDLNPKLMQALSMLACHCPNFWAM
jgi:hypothetical protein